MDTKELLHVVDSLTATKYQHIELNHEGSSLILSNVSGKTSQSPARSQTFDQPRNPEDEEVSHETSKVPDQEVEGHLVESPIVGTFYDAPSPDEPAFVKVGDSVKKGDVLCIIEAMKLMNEIEAEMDGTLVEVLVNNEDPVEYGQGLFRIK